MKLKISAIIILLLFVSACIYLFATRADSVVYKSKSIGFVILNPFRDREPEKLSEGLLTQLRRKECEQGLNFDGLTDEQREHYCLRESWFPLRNWTLRDRGDQLEETHLFYITERGYMTDVGLSNETIATLPIIITVRKANGSWQIQGFNAGY